MKKLVSKDKQRRQLESKFYYKRLLLKYILRKNYIKDDFYLYMNIKNKLETMPINTSKTRINNRCFVTGRSFGVYRKFKLSRINIRELGSNGMISGLKKSSW